MASRVERQKQIRAEWESENGLIRRSSKVTKSSDGIKTAIENEIKEQQEREVVHKQYLESLVKRTNSCKSSQQPQTLPPLGLPPTSLQEFHRNHPHHTTYPYHNSVIPLPSPSSSQYSSLSNTSSRQSTMEAESSLVSARTPDPNCDSAFGSQVDFGNEDEEPDPAFLDEDSFATESLPIGKKKKYWEHKYKKVYDYEKAYLENEKHLAKLRQRKESSRWNSVERPNSVGSSLTRSMSESSLLSTPTCELIDSHGNTLHYNSPKPVVGDLKDHWDEKLNSPSDVSDSFRVPADALMKQELKELKKREKEWSKQQQRQQSSSFNQTLNPKQPETTNLDANAHGVTPKPSYSMNGEMKRSQSYSSLTAFSFIPSPESETSKDVKVLRKKPKMLHERMYKGDNVKVQLENRERSKAENHQPIILPQIRSSNRIPNGNAAQTSPVKNKKFQNELKTHLMKTYPVPHGFGDHDGTSTQNGHRENSFAKASEPKQTSRPQLYHKKQANSYPVLKPTNAYPVLPSPGGVGSKQRGLPNVQIISKLPEKNVIIKEAPNATTNGPTNIAPTSNSKEEHKKVGGSHHTEKKAIKDVLRTPTSSVLEKRKSLSKKWDDVCRKNEPKFEF